MTDIDYERVAREAGLQPLGRRLPLHRYIAQAWRSRRLAAAFVSARISAEYGDNRFGMAWVVLKPIMMAAVYGAVFGLILAGMRPPNFIPYLVVGVFVFEFFFKSFGLGAKAIVGNVGLVRNVAFPRAILPVAIVLQSAFEMIPVTIVMYVILAIFGQTITWSWLLVPPILLMMLVFNIGVAMIAARLTVHFRDVTQVVPFISRIIFYSSGIFYQLDVVLDKHPQLLQLALLNPVHNYIALVRGMVLEGATTSPELWWLGAGAAVVTFLFGLVFFWQAEERYGLE